VDRLGRASLGVVIGVAVAPWLGGTVGGLTGLLLVLIGLCGCSGTRRAAEVGAGVVLGLLAVASMPEGPALEGHVAVQGVVVGAATGTTAAVSATRFAAPGEPWAEVSGRVQVRFPDRPPPPGARVVVYGRAGPLRGRALPGGPDPLRNAARSRIRTRLWTERWAVLGGVPARADRFPEREPAGVLQALATGDRSGVSEATWTVLRRSGTAHLLAISGFHVGLVALVAVGAARLPLRAAALLRRRGVGDRLAWVVGVAVGLAYAWSVGAPVSAQRAACMVALVGVARATGRQVRPLPLLGAVAAALLVVDPAALGTPSFQLSFGAVLGLVRLTPWLLRWLPPDLPPGVGWAARALSATLGATVGTLPAGAWWFQQLAPLSPLANLVALPWVAFVVVPSALIAGWGPEPLSTGALWVGEQAVAVLLVVLEPLATRPLAPALTGVEVAFLLAALLVPRRALVVGAVLVLLLGAPRVQPSCPVVTFLDVGQGDAALVELPDGRRWLVDGGPPGRQVLHWLRRRRIRHLDRVVVSHGHPDHVGGLVPVVEALTIDEIWVPSAEGLDELLEVARARGTPVVWGSPWALHPRPGFAGANTNDRSLVLSVAGVLFTGDVEAAGEAALLGRGGLGARVLKVPHHGSRSSSSDELLDVVRPDLAVISAGSHNRFGHPHPTVLARLADHDLPVVRTDRDGTVEVRLLPDVLEVRSWAPGSGWSAPLRISSRGPSPDQGRSARPGPTGKAARR